MEEQEAQQRQNILPRPLVLESECNLRTKQKPSLFTDNQAIFKILENATSSKRLRHLDLPYHEIRNLVSRDEVNIKFVHSKDQLADMLAKAVPEATINEVKRILKMLSPSGNSTDGYDVNFIYIHCLRKYGLMCNHCATIPWSKSHRGISI